VIFLLSDGWRSAQEHDGALRRSGNYIPICCILHRSRCVWQRLPALHCSGMTKPCNSLLSSGKLQHVAVMALCWNKFYIVVIKYLTFLARLMLGHLGSHQQSDAMIAQPNLLQTPAQRPVLRQRRQSRRTAPAPRRRSNRQQPRNRVTARAHASQRRQRWQNPAPVRR